jgi:hypothetical protein
VADNQLPIPEAAGREPESVERLRVWLVSEQQHVNLRVGVWSDPAGWGGMLADLARHVANAYKHEKGLARPKTLERVKAGMGA